MRAAWRWRARQAALKAGQGAASGLVASAALGNEVRPRSAARQGTAGRFGRHGDDGGASPSAWRGVCVNGRRPARAHLSEVGRGQRRGEAAQRQRGSEAAAVAQRGTEGAARQRAHARSSGGVSGEAWRQRGGSEAARQRDRGSGAARHARAVLKCLRACRAKRGESARERRERKRSGERKENVNGLTWSKLKICN